MIDVQQRALGALEEDPLAGVHGVQQVGGGVGHEGPQPLGITLVLGIDFRGVQRGAVGRSRGAAEHLVLRPHDLVDPPAEAGAIQVAQADGMDAADLVAIAGADAAQRGAERLAAGALDPTGGLPRKCQGKIRWARSLRIRLRPTWTPRAIRPSISSSRLAGLRTTPAATTHWTWGRKMPLGMSESLKVCPPVTTVWPALAPPW